MKVRRVVGYVVLFFVVAGIVGDAADNAPAGWVAGLAVVLAWRRFMPRLAARTTARRLDEARPKGEALRRSDLHAYKAILDEATEPLAFTDPDAYVGLRAAARESDKT